MNPAPTTHARVILLSGPSGSGKSSLAERSGLPVLQLDDFYKDGDDPTLPRLPDGAVDWDSPLAWHRDQAVAAIRALYEHGRAEVPVYSIPDNGRVSTRPLDLGGATAFIAEAYSPPRSSPSAGPRACSGTPCACATARSPRPGAGCAGTSGRAASRCRCCCAGASG